MMLATAGRSPARLAPKAVGGFDTSVEGDSGAGPLASLSRIPAGAPIRRKCAACDQDNDSPLSLSPKLEVGAIDDPAEREADAVADRVMASDGGGSTLPIPNSTAPAPIRQKAAGGAASSGGKGTATVGGAPAKAIGALGGGEAMPASDRAFFEPRLGQDLSHVRLHRGAHAEAAAAGIGARAFTIGSNIVMGQGEYGSSQASRHLMAHELAHVQQNDFAQDGTTLRMACSDPVATCEPAKQKDRQDKVTAKGLSFNSWEYRATTSACFDPAAMAVAIKASKPNLFTGNIGNYKDDIVKHNDIKVKKQKGKKDQLVIGVGECFAFPVGWIDPKIGDVNAQIKALNKTGNEAERNRVVAAIYGEQSNQNETGIAAAEKAYADQEVKYDAEKDAQKKLEILRTFQGLHSDIQIAKRYDIQRKYIYYAMLLRIEGFEADWGPDFASVVTPGTFHSLQTDSGTHKNNYLPAVEHLEGKKPTKSVNTAAIDRLKGVVGSSTRSTIPSDAGPYYFHWWDNSTAEKKYQELIKKGTSADIAEKAAAWHHAKKLLGATLTGISEQQGWLKKITGPNHGKANERIGSMYIFR